MKMIPILVFENYVPAHIAKGRLEEEGITCWLKDENTVTLDPILTNAIGGIKLMVPEKDATRAWQLLKGLERTHKAETPCPQCKSVNVEIINTPRNPVNWVFALFGWSFASYAMPYYMAYHCFDCGKEFPFE